MTDQSRERRQPRAVLAALILLGGLMADAQAQELPRLASTSTILAFGDSLTSGVGGSGESYPQRLAQLIGVDVINAGSPGETTEQGLRRLPAALAASRPTLLILCLGINDFLHAVPRPQLRDNLRSMLALATATGVPVLLLAVPPPGRRLADPLYAELGAARHVAVDQHAMADVLGSPALKADLVHPNAAGYRQVAEAVARRLRDSGALPAR